MNRLGMAAGAAVMAATIVATGPASPAQALATPPPPSTFTTTFLAGSGAPAAEVSTSLVASGGKAVLTGANAAKAGTLAAESASGVVAVGWMVGTYGGVQIAKALGLPTKGDIWCDTLSIWDTDACATGAAPEYLVNSDVVVHAPGWLDGANTVTRNVSIGGAVSVAFDVSAPGNGQSGPMVFTTAATFPANCGYRGCMGEVHSTWYVYTWSTDGGASTRSLGSLLWNADAYEPKLFATNSWSTTVSHLDRVQVVEDGTTVATWYPVGNPLRPADSDPDPVRTWRTTWECTGGVTGSAESAPFRESDPEWPGLPTAQCGSGALVHLLVQQITQGGPTTTITEWTAPQVVRDWASSRPDCVAGGCLLELFRVDPATGAQLSCFANPLSCVDWYSDPAKADTYRCVYGGQAVALSECDLYRPTFNVTAGKPTKDNEGKDQPAATTSPYGDPKHEGNPVPATDPAPTPEQPDDGCPPPFSFTAGGIGYWVTKGVSCALSWAFVPTQTQTKVQDIATQAATKTPFIELGSFATALSPPDVGGSCLVLSLPLTFVLGHDVPLINTCDFSDPVSKIVHEYRPLLGAAVWVMIIAPIAWWAWKQYAPGATGAA